MQYGCLRLKKATALLAGCLLCLGVFDATANSFDGTVVKVADGDTITVIDKQQRRITVRLVGIDAPEIKQPHGAAARRHLRGLVEQQRVRVEGSGLDHYGRLLGTVWVRPADCAACAATLDVNRAQIVAGMAWWYRPYAKEQDAVARKEYERAEARARSSRVGLWSNTDPVAPWDWRHKTQASASKPPPANAQAPGGCTIKGNINGDDERIYHVPGQLHYAQTRISTARGERWFCSESEARAAGWRAARQ